MALPTSIIVAVLGANSTALIGLVGYLGQKTIDNETRSKINRKLITND